MNPFLKCRDVLVGLEFIIHIVDASEHPFVCALCDKKGTFDIIISHLTSDNHRWKFLRTCLPQVAAVTKDRNIVPILCQQIDRIWGRGSPFWTYEDHYSSTLMDVQNEIVKAGKFWFRSNANLRKKLMRIATQENNNSTVDLTSSEESDNASDCEIIEPVHVLIEVSDDEVPSKKQKIEVESILPVKIEPKVLQEAELSQSDWTNWKRNQVIDE